MTGEGRANRHCRAKKIVAQKRMIVGGVPDGDAALVLDASGPSGDVAGVGDFPELGGGRIGRFQAPGVIDRDVPVIGSVDQKHRRVSPR